MASPFGNRVLHLRNLQDKQWQAAYNSFRLTMLAGRKSRVHSLLECTRIDVLTPAPPNN
jgi:hypothetical protein